MTFDLKIRCEVWRLWRRVAVGSVDHPYKWCMDVCFYINRRFFIRTSKFVCNYTVKLYLNCSFSMDFSYFFAICFLYLLSCLPTSLRRHCVVSLEIKFTHANVQGLWEILNSTERTCSLKISGFWNVWKSLFACGCNINAFGFLGLVTFSPQRGGGGGGGRLGQKKPENTYPL